MNIIFDDINIVLMFSALLEVLMLFYVYSNNANRHVNRLYSLNIIAVICWTFTMIVFRSSPQEHLEISLRFLYFFPTLIASTFLYLTYLFPFTSNKNLNFRKIIILLLNIVATVFIFASGDLMIRDVEFRLGSENVIIFGKYFFLYGLYLHSIFAYGFYRLIKRYYSTIKISKAQIAYLLLGYITSVFVASVTNLYLPYSGEYEWHWFGQVISVFMIFLNTYAITSKRLMNIKLVIRKYLAYVSTLFLLLSALMFVHVLFIRYQILNVIWIEYVLIALMIISFSVVKRSISRLIDHYFYSALYDSKHVVARLSDRLRLTLGVRRIYDLIHETLEDVFDIDSFAVLSYDPEDDDYIIRYNKGFDLGGRKVFPRNLSLRESFISKGEPIVLGEVRRYDYNKKTKVMIDLLMHYGAEIVAPLNIKNKAIGVMVLGKKKSDDMYTDDDIKLLKVISSQVVIAIENAMLYEETLNFNARLEDEIEIAVADLLRANKKLKKLDRAKSEFISIASHQLRTPLTVIKGYIAMMMEGNFGELDKKIKLPLKKVYSSNERLIKLVENLLNISRIESGRLDYNMRLMQLEDIIESVCEELVMQAEKKGIVLKCLSSLKKLDKVKIDEEKIRQVLMNLIDNAIKYTKEGEVVVGLEQKNNELIFSVSDSGMGIKVDDAPNLFKKFVRGTGTALVHTEGTGLGLYVAKSMIEAHGGEIWAESDGDGKGSKFVFKLPIKN